MVLAHVPALACVCKELPLPEDALRLVGQYLRRPTPTGAIVLKGAPKREMSRDICRWLVYEGLEQAGMEGFGRFVISSAFRVHFDSRLQVFMLRHRKLAYTEEFCGYCHRQFLGVQCQERCFLRTSS